jgi:hypothetical protein
MSPLSLSDDELDQLMHMAHAVPVDHRDAFLRAVADALAKYPEGARGPGLIHREARMLQRQFTSPPSLLHEPKGATARYRC